MVGPGYRASERACFIWLEFTKNSVPQRVMGAGSARVDAPRASQCCARTAVPPRTTTASPRTIAGRAHGTRAPFSTSSSGSTAAPRARGTSPRHRASRPTDDEQHERREQHGCSSDECHESRRGLHRTRRRRPCLPAVSCGAERRAVRGGYDLFRTRVRPGKRRCRGHTRRLAHAVDGCGALPPCSRAASDAHTACAQS